MVMGLAPWAATRPAAGDAGSVVAMHSAPSATAAPRARSADGLDMRSPSSAALPTGLADGLANGHACDPRTCGRALRPQQRPIRPRRLRRAPPAAMGPPLTGARSAGDSAGMKLREPP